MFVFTSPDVQTDTPRSVISMDRQSVVTDLSLKGLNAIEVHNDLGATLKGDAKYYNTVTYYRGRKSSEAAPISVNINNMKKLWYHPKLDIK
jgi:hypothetical protein